MAATNNAQTVQTMKLSESIKPIIYLKSHTDEYNGMPARGRGKPLKKASSDILCQVKKPGG